MTDQQWPDETPSEVTGITIQLVAFEGYPMVRVTYADRRVDSMTRQELVAIVEHRLDPVADWTAVERLGESATGWTSVLPADTTHDTTGRSDIDPFDIAVPRYLTAGYYRVIVASSIDTGESFESERIIQVYKVSDDHGIRRIV